MRIKKDGKLNLIESPFKLVASHDKGREWDIVVIKAGLSKNRTFYTEEALRKSAKLFEGAKVCAYGFDPEKAEHVPNDARDKAPGGFVQNVVGVLKNARFDESTKEIKARFVILENADWLRKQFLSLHEAGKLDALGFSIDAKGKAQIDEHEGQKVAKVVVIEEVLELTVVTHPAAGGRMERLVASIDKENMPLAILSRIREAFGHWLEGFDTSAVKKDTALDLVTQIVESARERALRKMAVSDAGSKAFKEAGEMLQALQTLLTMLQEGKVKEAMSALEQLIASMKQDEEPAEAPPADETETEETTEGKDKQESEDSDKEGAMLTKEEAKKLKERQDKLEEQLREERSKNILNRLLNESDLPDAAKVRVRKLFEGREATDEAVQEAIKAEKDYLATLSKSGDIVDGGGRKDDVQVTEERREKYKKAMLGMLMGEDIDGVQQFPGIHESYRIITGRSGSREQVARAIMVQMAASSPDLGIQEWGKDERRERHFAHVRESAGMFPIHLKEVLLTTDWAEVFGDSVRRALIRHYSADNFQIWRQVVSDTPPLQDFRTNRRVRVGGLGDLATVAENAAYADFTNPGDEEVTYAASKRGNLFPVTWEAMLQDDLGRLRQIPRDIGRTAGRTLAKDVLVTNLMANPVIFDAVALIAAGHNNNQVAALSEATLQIAIQQMRKQTELTSGERLSINPRYLLVPPDLENLAWELTASRVKVTAGENSTINNSIKEQFRIQPVVVPWQTDVNNWFLVADPRENPTLEVGFLGGRQTPEIFVQEANNLGAVTTNDRITWKVRFAWGTAVLDFRTFAGSIVP